LAARPGRTVQDVELMTESEELSPKREARSECDEGVATSEAGAAFMVGRLSTESCCCNSVNLDRIFGNDRNDGGHRNKNRG
jgi:hypothetical protein